MNVKTGDWVCFYRSGELVYAKVEYCHPRKSWPRADEICTTDGAISEDSILEVRREEVKDDN